MVRRVVASGSEATVRESGATELSIDAATTGELDPGRRANTAAAIATIASRRHPVLRSLAIIEHVVEAPEESFSAAPGCSHDVDVLWRQVPNLEHLHLGGLEMVHALDAPRLRTLVVDDVPFCDAGDWNAPLLESITWRSFWNTTGTPSDSDLSHLERLWERELPSLRELAVDGYFTQRDAALEIPDVLDVIGRLSRFAAPEAFLTGYPRRRDLPQLLLARAPHLAHLSSLTITRVASTCTTDERAALRAVLPNLALELE